MPRSPYDIPPLWQQLCHPVKLLARVFDLTFSSLRPDSTARRNITLVCMSDTHTMIPSYPIPHGDILIHAGDMANVGTPEELQAQIDWMASLPHKHKIIVAGNHDAWFDPKSRQSLPDPSAPGPDLKGITYLQDSSVTLTFPSRTSLNQGRLKIYGSPRTPDLLGPEHAFQYDRSDSAEVWTNQIPSDADIVVTHGPPRFHMDLPGVRALGDEYLLKEIRRVKPLVHAFGHVHAGKSDLFGVVRGGQEVVKWDHAEPYLAWTLAGGVPGFWHLIWYVILSSIAVLREVFGGVEVQSTKMVNTAMMYCNTGRLGNEAQVVHI